MPIYTYVCPKCQSKQDVMSSIVDINKERICKCGEVLIRVPTVPQPPVMKC